MMIKGYQTKILKIYDTLREDETRALKLRKAEIAKKCPQIIELDNKVQKLSLQMTVSVLKSKDSERTLEHFKENITDLRFKKCEMLVENGYDPEYINLHYHCNKCRDTGFLGNVKCSCYKQKVIKLYYKNSELENVIEFNNFNNF